MSVAVVTREQTRARYPDEEGYVERDGVRVFWERYGEGEETILLMPTWQIVHSRSWKAQIPYLARHARVLAFDPRGNGRTDRPADPEAYDRREFAEDAVAVLDAAAVERALVVSWCDEGQGLILAGDHPERVAGLVLISGYPVAGLPPERPELPFDDPLETDEGWAKENRHYWLRDWQGYVEWFFSRCFTEPHSTKQTEDAAGWGLETDAETLLVEDEPTYPTKETALELCSRVSCPALVVSGSEDAIHDSAGAEELATALGASHLVFDGSGHAPHLRDPVRFNTELADFAGLVPATRTWTRGTSRRKRALFICSPIGLGHAQRDVAIARELRQLHPDLEIDWLAQHPVTAVLEGEGERVHPMSAELANESHHIESESAEHDLHCFQAWRRMDEILLANFMVFHDVVREESYDLWIGDEAWELDYYLHENPEEKRAAYVWLTDFVGWLPMADGGEREAFVTADYNAEMIEHIARFPRVRDRALYVGNPDDVVADPFGPDLPLIRDWTEDHFDFAGYVTGFDPSAFSDREKLRAELGYAPGELVCVVTVGGSGVGGHLLRRVVDAFPQAKELVPELRMVVVAGPRIDPAAFPEADGLEAHAYVHNLYRHLAAGDLAVVQGGLTTAMELTANRRPFLYFPLRHHFEQNFHVRHRLERYGAGRAMDFEAATPTVIAEAIAVEIGREVDYRPVETDGASKAAARIAELL